MNLLKCLLLSLLPPRYRNSYARQAPRTMALAAGLTGFLQMMFFGLLFMGGFIEYRKTVLIGYLAFLEYLVFPKTWLLSLLWFDGAIRMLSALGGQAIAPLPCYLLSGIHRLLERLGRRAARGARIIDLVEPGDGTRCALRISSCRPKPNWDHLMTVMYEEKLYEIAAQETAAPPRPFVYLLRPRPDHKALRGLHRYSPQEVLFSKDN